MIDVIKGAMLLTGSSFMLLAAVGLLRLPDLLTRMHATTKAAALGVILIMLASAMHFAEVGVVARSFAIIVFILITAPIAAHARCVSTAWHRAGNRLASRWQREGAERVPQPRLESAECRHEDLQPTDDRRGCYDLRVG